MKKLYRPVKYAAPYRNRTVMAFTRKRERESVYINGTRFICILKRTTEMNTKWGEFSATKCN
jgi:hypothetical protein